MGEHQIEYVKQVKYLGVTLDHRLSWQPHIKNRIKKAKGLLFKARQAMGKLWGLKPTLSLWMYHAVVIPMLRYAALVWVRDTYLTDIVKKFKGL